MRMTVSLYRVLIDTSVWLDMACSYRAAPLVRALHEMCDNAQLEIIVPDIVREEFVRNKDRVTTQSTKALQSHVKSLRYALTGHADQVIAQQAQDVLQGLDFSNATQKNSIADQVQELMDHGENINVETSVFHRARAANRSLYGEAPCHRDKGSIADAILFEIYDEIRQEPVRDHIAFGFATTNHKDLAIPKVITARRIQSWLTPSVNGPNTYWTLAISSKRQTQAHLKWEISNWATALNFAR